MCHLRLVYTTILLFLAALIGGCIDGGHDSEPAPSYSATIERTQYGTAHVTADNWGSLGFGQGYATAEDRFCVMADQFLKVRSQRARYFGPGENDEHINSDFAYLALEVIGKGRSRILEQPGTPEEQGHGARLCGGDQSVS